MSEKSTDVIRQGYVSSINYQAGRIRVVYPDKNNAVTAELPLQSYEYDMPKVGDMVYVTHQSNGVEKGLVLSRYWNDGEVPAEYGPHIWRKELRDFPSFSEGSYFKFDRDTHTLTIEIKGSPEMSVNIITDKDVSVSTGGNAAVDAKENVFVNALESVTISASENIEVNAEGDVSIKANGSAYINAAENICVEALGEMNINAVGKLFIGSDEKITIVAPKVDIIEGDGT